MNSSEADYAESPGKLTYLQKKMKKPVTVNQILMNAISAGEK